MLILLTVTALLSEIKTMYSIAYCCGVEIAIKNHEISLIFLGVSLQDLRASGCCSSDGDPRRHVVLGRTEKQRSWLIQGVSSSLHTGIMDQHTCTSANSHTLAYFSYCFSTTVCSVWLFCTHTKPRSATTPKCAA